MTHEREAMAVPPALTFTDAAALPEAFATAFDALVTQGGMTVGSRVLVHAVGSGVGTAALQLGRLFGATVIGTGRQQAKLDRAQALGLQHPVLVTDGAFAAQVKALGGADLTLDLVGGAYTAESLEALSPGGTLILVGLVAGRSVELPLGKVLSKRLTLVGTVMRARPLEEKISVARAMERRLAPHFASGALKAVVDEVLPMTSLVPALKRLAANDTFGKLVLTW